MMLFVAWTIFLLLGNLSGSSLLLVGGAGFTGFPDDGAASITLERAAEDPCRKVDEAGLKDLRNVSDLESIQTSLGSGSNDTIKTVARKIFNNTDETGHVTGNKTVVEKTKETDVKANGNVSKITETQIVIDEEGKESGEKSVTESETLTETSPNNGSLTLTVDVKKVTDEEGNEINEKVVKKKEATVQPLTNATEEKPKNDKAATLLFPKVGTDDQGKNKTETTFSASGKSDEPQKVERTEITKEILPGNKTNQILVTEKEEKLPSHETIKETSVETRNITENVDGPLIVDRTEKTKEILPGNETNEISVTEKEEKLPSQESITMTSVKSRNVTENGDGPLIVERTEKTKEILPGNETNEVVVTEKEERLPSHETIKETSVETRNVTENVDRPLVVERTEITKEILPGNKTNEVVVTEKEEKLPSRETAVTPPKVVKKIRRRKVCSCDSIGTILVVPEKLIERIAAVVLKEMTTE